MGITNTGIYQLGTLLTGVGSLYPTYMGFGTGSDTFVGTETSISGEFFRKAITWTTTGLYPKYTVEISSLEGNGSEFNSLGLLDGSTIGSDNLWQYDETYIGSKNNTFNSQIEGEFFIRRPTS